MRDITLWIREVYASLDYQSFMVRYKEYVPVDIVLNELFILNDQRTTFASIF